MKTKAANRKAAQAHLLLGQLHHRMSVRKHNDEKELRNDVFHTIAKVRDALRLVMTYTSAEDAKNNA